MHRIFPIVALITGTVVISTAPASAQGPGAPPSPPTWTIFGGATLATVEGPNDLNKEPLMGMAFGVALDWKINSTFMFQPELQYAEKGYQYNQAVPVRLKLTYVEVPLLLRASTVPLQNGTRLYGLFGPSLAMRRSCGASVGSASSKCNVLAQNMSTMDFGMVAGFGLDFRVLSSKWTASLRYDLGLSDQDRTGQSSKTRALNLLLGLRL
jgi:hypothetical protein